MNRGEQSVAIIKGKLTGDSRGFGFVEMSNKDHEERRAVARDEQSALFYFRGGFFPAWSLTSSSVTPR
jgi:hypothetical protein